MVDPLSGEPLVTLQEAADLAGLSEDEILALVESGQLTARRIPRTYRVVRRYRVGVC